MRKIMAITISASISGLLALSGCLGSDAADESVLEPHAVGNEWVYEYQDGVGVVSSEVTEKQVVTLESGESAIVHKLVEGPSRSPRFAAHGPEGLYTVYRVTEGGPFRRSLHLKHPADIGEAWTATYPVHEAGARLDDVPENLTSLEYAFVAKNQYLVTPAGRFRCNVYRTMYPPHIEGDEAWYSFRYFAPGIGLVAESVLSPDSTMPNPEETDLIVLRQYTLK